MQIYQEQRKIRQILRSRGFLIILGGVAIILLVASLRVSLRAYQASKAREEAEIEYQRLLAQKDRIDEKISDLKDPDAIEKEAKSRFNVTLPGEQVLIIVDRSQARDIETKPAGTKIWNFFKNIFI